MNGNLSATSSNDPFTLVFCGLWDMLENSQAFVNLVAPANRIKWLGEKVDPRKDQITDSDRPQIRVDFGDPFAEIEHVTGTDLLKCQWNIVAATNKQQIDRLGRNGLGASIAPGPVGDFRFPHRIRPGDQGPHLQRLAIRLQRQAGHAVGVDRQRQAARGNGRLDGRLALPHLAELQRPPELAHPRSVKVTTS